MQIKDVAREAGVSTATVSHVINKTRYVSEETRERVLRAIERLNYYPNANARRLSSGRSYTLGLLMSDISNPFFPELVKGFETAAFERGYDLILSNTNYDAERTAHYVRRIIESKVAGVALMVSEFDRPLIVDLVRRRVCVVLLDHGAVGQCMSKIEVDYAGGIEQAILHLLTLGHNQIAYVGGPPWLPSASKRLQAFCSSAARHLPEMGQPVLYEGDFGLEGGRRAARELLSTGASPSAVVVANDLMALGFVQECHSAGLQVPHDISVVGFDDIAFAALSDPPLTTVCLPRTELGRQAFKALVACIEHPERQGIEIKVPTYLVVRASTGPHGSLK